MSMLLGGVMFTVMSVVTIIEAVRLDDMAAAPRIVLSVEDHQRLLTAAGQADADRGDARAPVAPPV